MRRGSSVVAMPPEVLLTIFDEAHPDHSAQMCENATFDDLNADAINRFRAMWQQQSGNAMLASVSDRQLLLDAELIDDRDNVTHAALILLGEPHAVAKHLAQAETIFEYRSSGATIPYEQRMEFKQGFFLYFDKLWETINLRNEVFQYTDGLLRFEIQAINEAVAREAILNAITHRDYRLSGSIFIRQFPHCFPFAFKKRIGVNPGVDSGNATPQPHLHLRTEANRSAVIVRRAERRSTVAMRTSC